MVEVREEIVGELGEGGRIGKLGVGASWVDSWRDAA